MKRTRLGRSGPSVSAIGLGFWQAGSRLWSSSMTANELRLALEAARSHGIDFLDTAEVYGWGGSELMLGEALRAAGRDSFIVASKVGGFRVSSYEVVSSVKSINRRLGSAVDLIQLHWPPPAWSDLCEPIKGLERAVSYGLAHYYGLSNFDSADLEKALECGKKLEPVSDQVQYSLAFRAPEIRLKPLLESQGMALIAWSPLAKGALAGARPTSPAQRLDRVFSEASRDERLQSALGDVASKLGLTKAQLALAWVASKNAIPIPGFRNPRRVEEIGRAGDVELPEWAVKTLDEASAKYVERWGPSVWTSRSTRLIPATLQKIFIRLLGGI